MFDIPVYTDETKDGLTEQIKTLASVKIQAKISVPQNGKLDIAQLVEKLKSSNPNIASTLEEIDQSDLIHIVSILVSTGWNKNDDIFVPDETFGARETPVHKPINLGHDDGDIIGHIVQSKVLTKSGQEFTDTKDMPDEFDIEIGGVLYAMLSAHREEIENLISKANDGEAFVSMECWFDDFAYGLLDTEDNVTRIVARNEKTAFLTKHLRTFGGSGKFEGYSLGRVLLGIVFGGMGIVDDPANPNSIVKEIGKNDAKFKKVQINDITKGGVQNMAEIDELKTQLKDTCANVEAKDKEITKLNEQHTALTADLETANTQIQKQDETVKSLEKDLAEAKDKIDELVKQIDTAQTELDDIRKNAVSKDRLAQLCSVSKVEDEEAALAELREMDDETFAIVLKYASKPTATSTPEEDKGEEVEEDPTEVLDGVKPNAEANLQVGDDADDDAVKTALQTAKCLLGHTD